MSTREFAQLAQCYTGQDVHGHYISRKLNGWGVIWDGGVTRGVLAAHVPWYYLGGDSRLKTQPVATGLWTIGRENKPKVIHAPDWYLDTLPIGVPLHGEFWHNDELDFVKSVCGQGHGGRFDDRWKQISFQVYNIKPFVCFPGIERFVEQQFVLNNTDLLHKYVVFYQNNLSWLSRMSAALDVVKSKSPSFFTYSNFLKQDPIHHVDEIKEFQNYVGLKKWEGLMLINPDGRYECSRSWDLLKIKEFFDIEATIVGYRMGERGNLNKMGALVCETTWDEKVLGFTGGRKSHIGRRVNFAVGGGFEKRQREWDYVSACFAIGKTIPVKFLYLSKDGIPQSPNFIREEKV
jgi:hypothetical protein